MARFQAFEAPFFASVWRRAVLVAGGLILGLVVFLFGFSYTGTAICAVFFWLGYELLVVFDNDVGRVRKQPGGRDD